MRRIIITAVVVILGAAVIGTSVVAYRFLCKGPSIEITGDAHQKKFLATFLGEYCDSLSNVTVTNATTNTIVWSVDIKRGVPFCDFSLSPGNNPALQEGVSRVVVPANESNFTLTPQTTYKVTVRRAGSTTRCGVGTAAFQF